MPPTKRAPEAGGRPSSFTTISGRTVEPLYTPEDAAGLDYAAAVDPILIAHRDRIMRAHFKLPMEL